MNPNLKNSKIFLNSENDKTYFFAEIIQSTLQSFTAQSWAWDHFPKFGSVIQVQSENKKIIGCVTQVETGSIDPMRLPFPYKKTEEELMIEQPQIFEFLRTTFNVQIIGYVEDEKNKIYYQLAPTPCKIHSFVRECSDEIFAIFFQKSLYIHILFASLNQGANLDELLLAILSNLKNKSLLNQKVLDDFCRTFSLLTGNDYLRLKLFLKRVEKIVI